MICERFAEILLEIHQGEFDFEFRRRDVAFVLFDLYVVGLFCLCVARFRAGEIDLSLGELFFEVARIKLDEDFAVTDVFGVIMEPSGTILMMVARPSTSDLRSMDFRALMLPLSVTVTVRLSRRPEGAESFGRCRRGGFTRGQYHNQHRHNNDD